MRFELMDFPLSFCVHYDGKRLIEARRCFFIPAQGRRPTCCFTVNQCEVMVGITRINEVVYSEPKNGSFNKQCMPSSASQSVSLDFNLSGSGGAVAGPRDPVPVTCRRDAIRRSEILTSPDLAANLNPQEPFKKSQLTHPPSCCI